MGNQPSMPCIADCAAMDTPPRAPVVVERIYGQAARHIACVRIQTAARAWMARAEVEAVRCRAIALQQHRCSTLEAQIDSAEGRLERELELNAALQAEAREGGTEGALAAAARVRWGRRGWARRGAAALAGAVQRGGGWLVGGEATDVSGVWTADGRQDGEALSEHFYLVQDEAAHTDVPSRETLQSELRQLETREEVEEFALAAGVDENLLAQAASKGQSRRAVTELVLEQLTPEEDSEATAAAVGGGWRRRRRGIAASFAGGSLDGVAEPFRIVRGRIYRSAQGSLSVRFVQQYQDGETVCWAAKLSSSGGGGGGGERSLAMEEGCWRGLGVVGGRFTARRAEARESRLGVHGGGGGSSYSGGGEGEAEAEAEAELEMLRLAGLRRRALQLGAGESTPTHGRAPTLAPPPSLQLAEIALRHVMRP
jgi:hypothetical protein